MSVPWDLALTLYRQLHGALAFLGGVTLLEMLWPRATFALRDRLRGVGFLLVGVAASMLIVGVLSRLWVATGVGAVVSLKFSAWFGWAEPFGAALAILAALLLTDLFGYWYHRIQHAWLWPFHALHHSIEDLNAANSFVYVGEDAFRFVFMVAPMSLIPFVIDVQPQVVGIYLGLSQFFIHSPTKLNFGPLRYFLTDNVYHRIHHSTDPAHFNRNYGTTFTVWDQLFGTAYFPRRGEWPETGLAGIASPKTFREWFDFPVRFMRQRRAASVNS